MLTKIMKTLEQGGAYSQKDLAKCFGVSEELINAQIEFLENKGYIKLVKMPACRGKTCIGCKGNIQKIKMPVMWEIAQNQ